MAKVLTSISFDNPTGPLSIAPSDTFSFTGTPTLTGGGGVQRYDWKWEVNDGGGYVTIASSGTGLTTADTNPIINTNSQSANSITVTATDAGSYTIRMAGAPTSGGSYTVFSSTQTVTVLNAYAITADSGTYASSGQDASVLHGTALAADAGAYSTTGQDATITYTPAAGGYEIVADAGSYTSTGQSADVLRSKVVVADAGTYTSAGQDAAINKGLTIVGEHGVYTVSGQDASINRGLAFAVDAGVYDTSGQDVSILKTSILNGEAGVYSSTGVDATLLHNKVISALAGAYTSVGRNATIAYASIYPDPQYVLEGILYGPGQIYTGTLEALDKSVKVDLSTGKLVKPINNKVVLTL